MINVSILGYGTIGSGVFQIIRENGQIIAERTGEDNSKIYTGFKGFPR